MLTCQVVRARPVDTSGQASKLSADHESATIFFSFPFSSSSCRSRFISDRRSSLGLAQDEGDLRLR
jgi:hypothetical protein